MRKQRILLCLVACALLLSGCAPISSPIVETTPIPRVHSVLPSADEGQGRAAQSEATLYFRFQSEPYLAAEARAIRQLPSQSYEMALLTELLSGPSTASPELTGLFPTDTRVLATQRAGRTLFVTLSAEILNNYPNEPVDWQEHEDWLRESPLRRRLCMQSIVATVTENCDVDQVQIQVQVSGVANSPRLAQSFFLDGSEDNVIAPPLTRDDSLLLTPGVLLDTVLTCWQQRNWSQLYLYISLRDSASGSERPSLRDFVSQMEGLAPVVGFSRGEISVSSGGTLAVCAVNFTVLRGMETHTLSRRILHLEREGSLWKIGLSQLTGWLEE